MDGCLPPSGLLCPEWNRYCCSHALYLLHLTLQLCLSPHVLTEFLLPWGVALSLAPSGQGPGHISSAPYMHSCGRQNGELTLRGGKTQVLPLDPEACVCAKDAG